MNYILQKDYETPCFIIRKGVVKTEPEWIKDMPRLQKGDCDIKKDWFKKEEPKEWEILTCYDGVNAEATVHDFIPANNHKGSEPCIGGIINCKIHSVKRLSDGEVFTVDTDTNFGKIKSFLLNDVNYMEERLRNGIKSPYEYINKMFVEFHPKSESEKWSPQHLCNVIKRQPPKEEPIPIKVMVARQHSGMMEVLTHEPIPDEKYEPIKKAIQSVLNGNDNKKFFWYENDKPKLYTYDELLQARKEAFEAGRKMDGLWYRHPNVNSYINSLNK